MKAAILCALLLGACSLKTPAEEPRAIVEVRDNGAVPDSLRHVPRLPDVTLYFEMGKTVVREKAKIRDILRHMKDTSRIVVLVGHACPIGAERYNLTLATKRAAAVETHLIRCGINPLRIQTMSYGELKPLPGLHWRNRRVDVYFERGY